MCNCYTNYSNELPKITIYANCDNTLTINLGCFSFAPREQLIFVIKNHDYIGAPVEFSETIIPSELNTEKNISILIPKEATNSIKNGAIYTFMLKKADAQYSKLTSNGLVQVEYGAQDFELGEDNYE